MGFSVQKVRPIREEAITDLSRLLVSVVIPVFVFFSIATNQELRRTNEMWAIAGAGALMTVGNYLLAAFVVRGLQVDKPQRSAFHFSMMLTNTMFLALPICTMLFGSQGTLFAVLYALGNDLVTLSLGVWTLQGGHATTGWRGLLANPLVWAMSAGLAWNYLQLPNPEIFTGAFEIVGDATLPLALILGGAKLADIHGRGKKYGEKLRRPLFGLTISRLILAPVLAGIIIVSLGLKSSFAGIVFIEAAMPVGITASIFARSYGADAEFTAMATLWSTTLALITAPLLIILFNTWIPLAMF